MDEKNRKLIELIKSKFHHAGLLWGILQLSFATMRKIKWTFSTLLYKQVIGHLGRSSVVKCPISLMYPQKIFIGDHCHIGVRSILTSENPEGSLIIKSNVSLVEECRIDFSGNVLIEQGAHLSPGCQIITHDHGWDPHNKPSFNSLKIGARSWIGSDSVILAGVSNIGDFAIVGAGSVVTRNVPVKAIIAGNPAKIIKYRDD